MRWDFALIIFTLVTVVPWRGIVRVRMLLARPQLSSSERISLYASTIAFQWLATAIVVWRSIARGVGPAALGLLPADPARGIKLGVAMAAAMALLQVASLRQLAKLPETERGRLHQIAARLMPRGLEDWLVFVALVGTVSLCEELIFRGFVFAVFRQLGAGSAALAILGSSAIFALGHIYQGKRGLVTTFVLGLMLAGARSWADSLLPPILTHLAVDLTAGFAGREKSGSQDG
jgi:membrane protease YdiL (CAAX protease family)